jgi:hypothetical protein
MNFQQIREQADRLRGLPLEAVLEIWGAHRDRWDPHKWHSPQGVLSVCGAKFMNWTRSQGGGGAIDLVMHLTQLGFTQSLQWLQEHGADLAARVPCSSRPAPELKLPRPDPCRLERVEHYLIVQRGLAPALIEPLVQAGSLYADGRANAVFLLRDRQARPRGAELRGTTPRPWRGMAPGSRKDLGYFAVPSTPGPTLILCESAIDALSCFALYPDHRCISTSGARPNPRWLAPLLAQGCSVYCGFDADPTGEAMAQAMISLYPSIQRLRPSLKDWNDVLRARP